MLYAGVERDLLSLEDKNIYYDFFFSKLISLYVQKNEF